jgi:hypothetical protein
LLFYLNCIKLRDADLENIIDERFSMPKPNYSMAKHSFEQEVIR